MEPVGRLVIRAMGAASLALVASLATAGVILEEKPVFQPTDAFSSAPFQCDGSVRTSFGDVLRPGMYVLKISGTGKPGEVLLTFATPAGAPAGKSLGTVKLLGGPDTKLLGGPDTRPAAKGPARTFAFSAVGLKANTLVKAQKRGGGGLLLTMGAKSPEGEVSIEARLAPAR